MVLLCCAVLALGCGRLTQADRIAVEAIASRDGWTALNVIEDVGDTAYDLVVIRAKVVKQTASWGGEVAYLYVIERCDFDHVMLKTFDGCHQIAAIETTSPTS